MVVGAGFIGMEVAYSLTKRGLKVTVVAPGAVPFQRQLGPEIGRVIQQVFEEQGVAFRLGARVVRLEGDDRVRAVVLDSGEKLPADLVVAGLGVRPATDFLKEWPSMLTAASRWIGICRLPRASMPPAISPAFPIGAPAS